MAILYAVVARGTVVLAEFAAVTGNAGAVARRILEKLPPESESESRLCFSQDRYIFHVLRSDGITYLCMANDTFGRRVPFLYLEDIHMRFMKNYGKVAHMALAYAMNDEFSRVLHHQMEFFSSNPSNDTLNRLRNEIHTIMVENIDKILDRGDKIALLVDRTATMQDSAFHFRKQSKRLRRALWLKNAKLLMVMTGLILVFLYLIIAACCGGLTLPHSGATVIPIESDSGTSVHRSGKAPADSIPPHIPITTDTGATGTSAPRKTRMPLLLRREKSGWRRGLAVFDFLLRVLAFGPTLAAAIATGTSDETLSFFTQFFQFHANFADFPVFTFFVVGNTVAAGYLVLSLPFSAVTVIRPKATGLRLLLLIFDTVILVLTTAAASSAAAIVYLAHNGNAKANWVAICMQFNGFCQRTSGAVVGSFIAVLIFVLLVIMSALAIRKH
ncbi:vesicle-associated membrane protein 714 [Carex littledalei]|uniref:CASP-like protein n=1 Tax=Carex littledalei TaxID=544730 RepID=A0A833VXF6_9POAL|nr:vesicle-associated membrane protein 714 [Carex littledalei]